MSTQELIEKIYNGDPDLDAERQFDETCLQNPQEIEASLRAISHQELLSEAPETEEFRKHQRKKLKGKKGRKWQNVTQNQEVTPLRYFRAKSLKDLQTIVQKAEAQALRIRAVGSGHSYSDVAVCSDYLLDIDKLNKLLALDEAGLKMHKRHLKYVNVEAGITIQRLNRKLDKQRKALFNMGAIDEQTLAGALATGTHGTGIDLTAFPGMLRSLVLVASGGKVYRIEPEDGITDPALHREEGVELVQNDHWFYSVGQAMGCMGIIYSVVLEVRDRYWLDESKTLHTWDEVKPQILDRSVFQGFRHVTIQINPYEIDGQHSCILVRQKYLMNKPRHLSLEDTTRNFTNNLLANIPLADEFAVAYLNLFPAKTPRTIDGALRRSRDQRFVQKSYHVQHQGHEKVKSEGMSAEFAFAFENNSFIEATEKVFELAHKIQQEGNLYLTSAVTLRFVKNSAMYLAPEYGRDTCFIDLPSLVRAKGAASVIDKFQDAMIALGGKPHWGKLHNRFTIGQHEPLRDNYPMFDRWLEVFKTLNHQGTFNNRFTDRLGISVGDADPGPLII
ncbi:FAD-binding protein [Rapidithrix thailandica]|uniref:FAD-binding protein n=1 Tax=Rapidithrix thailandica TaxID=413964 RepID=A0AAW9SBL7_9BACT